jgi:hypothetical protein
VPFNTSSLHRYPVPLAIGETDIFFSSLVRSWPTIYSSTYVFSLHLRIQPYVVAAAPANFPKFLKIVGSEKAATDGLKMQMSPKEPCIGYCQMQFVYLKNKKLVITCATTVVKRVCQLYLLCTRFVLSAPTHAAGCVRVLCSSSVDGGAGGY